MPDFDYKAIGDDGNIIEDVIEASHVGAVADKIDQLGYIPLSIKEHKSSEIKFFNQKPKVKHDEIVLFTKQLVTLIKAGVPFLTSLEALTDQASSETMKEIIRDLYISVESGKSFSEALADHGDVFPGLYVSSVRAGEISGQMDDVLDRMTVVLEHEKETREKISSAMRYPIIVVIALAVAFVIIIVMVVPKFAAMFQQLGAQLPLPTRMLIVTSNIFQHYWYAIIAVLGGSFVLFTKWKKSEEGRKQWDEWKLNLPLVGNLMMKNAMSRFAKMFETLNRSGLPILKTLDIVSDTVGNEYLGSVIKQVSAGVEGGEGITRPLKRTKLFPPMVVRMIAIGEQSGSLDEMLNKISEHYDLEVDYAIKKLTSMIEPILTIGIGIFLAIIALSIFLPMWNIMGLIK